MSDKENVGEEITPITVFKLLLFLIWWFSGIGVGTAFFTPSAIGDEISANLFLAIVLAFFCSALLIVALIPDSENRSEHEREADTDSTETVFKA